MTTTISLTDAANQREALKLLAKQTRESVPTLVVSKAARQIVAECPARDDQCELQAIFEAVKYGTTKVPGLEHGVRYTSDSSVRDQFFAPHILLQMCQEGACAGDCDDGNILVAALCASVGFEAGLYAYAPARAKTGDFEHVLAVVKYPKFPTPKRPLQYVPLDVTVKESYVGWGPPPGKSLIIWF